MTRVEAGGTSEAECDLSEVISGGVISLFHMLLRSLRAAAQFSWTP